MTIPILHAGLTFVGTTAAGHIVRLWPTPRRDYWHVTYNRGHRATSEPTPGHAIPALLAAWGVEATSWTSWAVTPREKNPDLRFDPSSW